jgi:cobaltochelatase CobN
LAKQFPKYSFIQDPSSNFKQLYKIIQDKAKNIMYNKEFEHLFKGLNGEFVPINVGGDPIRQPDILPSGFNLYQFNPQLIPTDLAIERGKKIAEQSIELYRSENNGNYPKNIAIVLWGFETAKTHGESIGQIFHYMGIRLKQLTSWKREPELIPLKELGRPRINVTIQICGFMRDLFSHVLEILDDSIDLAINNDEDPEENYVKAHYIHIKSTELDNGKKEKDADFTARIRIFGPNVSEYGSNLPNIIDSSSWKKEEELGNVWINQMSYAYRRNSRAKQSKELFQKTLKNIDLINQIRDSVSYAITDLDHYYEFIGGLNQASKLSGNTKGPKIYISDTSAVKVETTTIKTAINRGTITRTANPIWVKEMLKHDYTGGSKVADRINYLLGFAATTSQVDTETWNQIHKIAAEALGAELKPVYITSEFIYKMYPEIGDGLVGDKTYCAIFDNSKIRRVVPDFKATISFKEGMRRSVLWYDEHPEAKKSNTATADSVRTEPCTRDTAR